MSISERLQAIKKQRALNRRFPLRWLNYQKRLQTDVERAYALPGSEEVFGEKFEQGLITSARELERWQIRLILFQTALLGYLALSFLPIAPTISFLGISTSETSGLKEVFLLISATITLLTLLITSSKEMRLIVLQKLTELKTDEKFWDIAAIAVPASFHLRMYITKGFRNFIFPTIFTRLIFGVLVALFVVAALGLWFGSIALQVYLFLQIYQHPSIEVLSSVTLFYVALTMAIGLLWFVRFYVPLPFRDSSVLKELEMLRDSNPEAYQRRLQELWGSKISE